MYHHVQLYPPYTVTIVNRSYDPLPCGQNMFGEYIDYLKKKVFFPHHDTKSLILLLHDHLMFFWVNSSFFLVFQEIGETKIFPSTTSFSRLAFPDGVFI